MSSGDEEWTHRVGVESRYAIVDQKLLNTYRRSTYCRSIQHVAAAKPQLGTERECWGVQFNVVDRPGLTRSAELVEREAWRAVFDADEAHAVTQTVAGEQYSWKSARGQGELVQPAAHAAKGMMMKHPLARTAGLVTVSDRDEVIVQTSEGIELARLSAHEARIWRTADGQTSVQRLASQSLPELAGDSEGDRQEFVWQVLDRLGDLGLLEIRAAPPGAVPFMSRRNLLTHAAAASVASVAAVVASDALLAAAAAETNGSIATCTSRAEPGGAGNRVESATGSRAEPGGLVNRVESVAGSRAEPGGLVNRVESVAGSRAEPGGARNRVESVRGSGRAASQVAGSGGDSGPASDSECNSVTPSAGAPPG